MTDREAIRRLADVVARIADCGGLNLAHLDAVRIGIDLAEPAAPTDDMANEFALMDESIKRGVKAWADRLGTSAAPTL